MPLSRPISKAGMYIAPALALLVLLSTSRVHAAIDAGRPVCDYCRMIMSDSSFSGQIGLDRGGKRIYDAIECMAAAVLTDSVPQRNIRSITVARHDRPSVRLSLDRAVFVYCPAIESPMGLSLAAFASRVQAERACSQNSGRVLDWRDVLERVNTTWFQGKLTVAPHAGTHAARPGMRAGKPH